MPEVCVGADSEAAAVEVGVSVGVNVVVPVDESFGDGVDVEVVCPLPYCVAERYATMAILRLAIPIALPIAVLIAVPMAVQ